MKYLRIAPHFVVKMGIQGLGVFATKNFKRGKTLFKLNGEVINHPTRTSIQIVKNKHVENIIGGYVNHSCKPSAKVNRRKKTFVSLRNIDKGDEITFDYNKNEDVLACPFRCRCCGRKIVGRKKLALKSKRGKRSYSAQHQSHHIHTR